LTDLCCFFPLPPKENSPSLSSFRCMYKSCAVTVPTSKSATPTIPVTIQTCPPLFFWSCPCPLVTFLVFFYNPALMIFLAGPGFPLCTVFFSYLDPPLSTPSEVPLFQGIFSCLFSQVKLEADSSVISLKFCKRSLPLLPVCPTVFRHLLPSSLDCLYMPLFFPFPNRTEPFFRRPFFSCSHRGMPLLFF